MASPPVEDKEPWEITIQGITYYAAAGTRDVLILVSSESGGADIVARKKGELTDKDKQRLTSEEIPQDCWDNEVEMTQERYKKYERCENEEKQILNIEVKDTSEMTRDSVIEKIGNQFNNTTADGVILHYIGPGRRRTGDWCFSDGFTSFTDIAKLYLKHFIGRTLYLMSDSSYSGHWLKYSKEFLHRNEVQPCGHSARKKEIKMKVNCSCQPHEIGYSLLCAARGGANDKNTKFPYLKLNKEIANGQTTCGEDFTNNVCGKPIEEECLVKPNYTFQQKNRIHLLNKTHQRHPVCYYVRLADDPEIIRQFEERIPREISDEEMSGYGEILESYWGEEPPQEVKDRMKKIIDGLEDLPPRH